MSLSRIALSFILFALLTGCTILNPEQATTPARILYHGGDILTMAGESPDYVEAVVTENGRILFAGRLDDARSRYGDFAEERDLGGMTMLPGFIDGHGHLYNVGLQAMSANMLPAPDGNGNSMDALVTTAREWNTQPQELKNKWGWIVGFGYDDSQLMEKRHPTASDLDRISTDDPVVLIHQSGHLAVINHKAMDLLGIDASVEDPPGGKYRRDADGTPTGVLEETAFFKTLEVLISRTDAELQQLFIEKGQQLYAQNGYTTAQDGRTFPDGTAAFARASADSTLFLDVVSYPDIITNRQAADSEFYGRDYTNRYRIGGLKLSLDGSPQGKTAWLTQCYHVNPEGVEGCYTGYPALQDEQATAYVRDAFTNNIQLICHVNGDAAIDQLIGAVRTVTNELGNTNRRAVAILIGPDERVPVYIALKSLTEWAAYQHFEEDTKGTIEAGKWADFVLIDKNPLEVIKTDLDNLKVMETISHGSSVYRKTN